MSGIVGGAGSKSGIIGETEPRFEKGVLTIAKNSGSASLDSSSGGCYQLLGGFCTVNIRVMFDGAGDMIYSGLPFTAARRVGTACRENQNVGDVALAYVDSGSSLFRVQTTGASNSHGDNDTFEFSLTYPITGTDID